MAVSRRSLDVSLIDVDTIREHFSYLYLFGDCCVGKWQIRNDKSGVIYIYKNNGVSIVLGDKNLVFRIKNHSHYLNVLDDIRNEITISTVGEMYSSVMRQEPIVCSVIIMNIYQDFIGDLLLQVSCCMLLTYKDFIRYTRG